MPILVTELGMVTEVKPVQLSKAWSPILVTELGINELLHPFIKVFDFVLIIALQLFLESKTVFPLSTTIEVKPLQELKAHSPIVFTEFGIVTSVKPLRLKALCPIDVTELGMVTEVKFVQP